MPAKKHSALSTRHDTAADRALRESAEKAMTPTKALRKVPPHALDGHEYAVKVWNRLRALYEKTEADLATPFDEDLLTIYCLEMEEAFVDLPKLKKTSLASFDRLETIVEELSKPGKDINLEQLMDVIKEKTKLLKEIKGIDARLDVKRSHIHKMMQSLYLTPRTRAGVAPPAKPPEEDLSEMDKLLDDD